jgi:glycosyltransferase involved in cell wall biosynthesis
MNQPRTSPLNVSFIITSLPVGGAETLLVNLVRRLDKSLVQPQVLCLKEAGALGDLIAREVPLQSKLLNGKFDFRILPRLISAFKSQQTDAVITVGAGDKMFWGRLAAKFAKVPVICSALHSTGWPDGVSKLNRILTSITDAFIACADHHAQHMLEQEGFPKSKVFMIPNGVDTLRFKPNAAQRGKLRSVLNLPEDTRLIGIVAALREEKNHTQLVLAARDVLRAHPNTHFLLVGDGPMRSSIESSIGENGLAAHFHLLGSRNDTHLILPALDAFVLTSKNEANPVSILEALACGIPVAAPRVGSIHETVIHEKTGLLTTPLDPFSTADALSRLLDNAVWSRQLGENGRREVEQFWSLDAMVGGYEKLIAMLYNIKAASNRLPEWRGAVNPMPADFNLQKTAAENLPSTFPADVFQAFPKLPSQVS